MELFNLNNTLFLFIELNTFVFLPLYLVIHTPKQMVCGSCRVVGPRKMVSWLELFDTSHLWNTGLTSEMARSFTRLVSRI